MYAYVILARNPGEKRPLGRTILAWEDNIKVIFIER
jgi:hypothetical protein